MRKNNKQVTTYFILFSLLLICVVYAILQANLQINGVAKIQANTWDIHFDNIRVNENSVSIGTGDSAATIDSENNCKVDFEVTLSIPGDFYEFTIDVVNAGTIDGMIGTLNKTLKVNNELVSEVPDYLDYSVTYSDGVEIEENHKIDAGTTETYLVRLEFKNDIEELPEATTITTTLEPQYVQSDSTSTHRARLLYNVLKTEAENGNELAKEFTGIHQDSFITNSTKSIFHWYASNDDNANTILDKWNVIFAGFCWQMWRTTDTGGVKLIFNGTPTDDGCFDETPYLTPDSPFNGNRYSLASVGYMYNPNTLISFKEYTSLENGILFGNDVVYENNSYTLTDKTTTPDAYHHYSCNDDIGTCSTIRYYYYFGGRYNYYVELSDGRSIETAVTDMLNSNEVNHTNSLIKDAIDTWYQQNMISYTSKLEDTIFCNDRSVINYAGWNPNGGSGNSLTFKNYDSISDSLICTNITDKFSLYNTKAQLIYPVGLMTAVEANLLNNRHLRDISKKYWIMASHSFWTKEIMGNYIEYDGRVSDTVMSNTISVRPVVSIKPGTLYTSGDGSKNNPYIVE